MYKTNWFCRWCGNEYRPDQETERDGFCSGKCKQALHRAYKAYTDYLLGKRGKRGIYKKQALPKIDRSKSAQPGTRRGRNAKKTKVSRSIMIIVLGAILFLCGCPDLRWNWTDNRKRIKPELLDDEYRQSQEYKERFDVLMYRFWEARQRRYANGLDPNLP